VDRFGVVSSSWILIVNHAPCEAKHGSLLHEAMRLIAERGVSIIAILSRNEASRTRS